MARPSVPVLAVLLGAAAFLFWLPWAWSTWDGRARSLVLPQLLWLGWALLMLLAARLPARRTVPAFLGSAATFYALWGVLYLVTSQYYLRTQHG